MGLGDCSQIYSYLPVRLGDEVIVRNFEPLPDSPLRFRSEVGRVCDVEVEVLKCVLYCVYTAVPVVHSVVRHSLTLGLWS